MSEDDYPVTYKVDLAAVRQENAHLRARLRGLQDECNRWARRWAFQHPNERGEELMSEQTNDAERLRILRAVRDGRMKVNEHGRYIIEGEARPDRKARERLLYKDGAISWPVWGDRVGRVGMRPAGRVLLDELEAFQHPNTPEQED